MVAACLAIGKKQPKRIPPAGMMVTPSPRMTSEFRSRPKRRWRSLWAGARKVRVDAGQHLRRLCRAAGAHLRGIEAAQRANVSGPRPSTLRLLHIAGRHHAIIVERGSLRPGGDTIDHGCAERVAGGSLGHGRDGEHTVPRGIHSELGLPPARRHEPKRLVSSRRSKSRRPRREPADRGPRSLIYEPFGLVHQWGNPGSEPLTCWT
jgi:hypothetical protein